MTTILKDGSEVEDSRLGRIYRQDLESLNYLVRNARSKVGLPVGLHKPRSHSWNIPIFLDQLMDGACVSTAWGHELAGYPAMVSGVTYPWCKERIYWEAQRIDDWPGGAYPGATPRYEGTSVLAGAKVCHGMGFITGYNWALTLEEVALGVGYHGPAVIGVNWYNGMQRTDSEGFIHPTGRIDGGHSVALQSVQIRYSRTTWGGWWRREWKDVDLDRSYFVIHNSWGRSWGVNGRAKITLREFSKLLAERGEVCFPVRNPDLRSVNDAA